MKKAVLGFTVALAACGGGSSTHQERYAVGTHLFTGSMFTGPSECTFDAPAGVLDGSMILKPGVITQTCPSGATSVIVAEYADRVALKFPTKAKVGEEVYLAFELRNAKDQQLTPTLAQMGEIKLAEGCAALAAPARDGAQDTGRSPFPSSKALAAGTCKVTVDIELPSASGKRTLHGEQTVTVTP